MRYTKCSIILAAGLLVLGPSLSAKIPSEGKAEQDRLENAGKVMQEILNVPDDIPQDLIDKARCVVVMPSVLKAAFVVGGSYGRGTMVCRTGKDFAGPWGAPAMYALEGGSVGLQIGGEATDFVFLVMNDRGAGSLLWGGRIRRCWTEGTFGFSRYGRLHACGDSGLLPRKRRICGYLL